MFDYWFLSYALWGFVLFSSFIAFYYQIIFLLLLFCVRLKLHIKIKYICESDPNLFSLHGKPSVKSKFKNNVGKSLGFAYHAK